MGFVLEMPGCWPGLLLGLLLLFKEEDPFLLLQKTLPLSRQNRQRFLLMPLAESEEEEEEEEEEGC